MFNFFQPNRPKDSEPKPTHTQNLAIEAVTDAEYEHKYHTRLTSTDMREDNVYNLYIRNDSSPGETYMATVRPYNFRQALGARGVEVATLNLDVVFQNLDLRPACEPIGGTLNDADDWYSQSLALRIGDGKFRVFPNGFFAAYETTENGLLVAEEVRSMQNSRIRVG